MRRSQKSSAPRTPKARCEHSQNRVKFVIESTRFLPVRALAKSASRTGAPMMFLGASAHRCAERVKFFILTIYANARTGARKAFAHSILDVKKRVIPSPKITRFSSGQRTKKMAAFSGRARVRGDSITRRETSRTNWQIHCSTLWRYRTSSECIRVRKL